MSEKDSKSSSYHESEVKPKNGKKREEKRLARLVQRKLEDYMNKTKREEHFDPAGVHRTTSRMHKYDLAYNIIEATTLEKSAKEKLKAQAKNGRNVQPKLVKNSRQVTPGMEAVSITESVTKVLEEVPVKDLTKIHSYKPLTPTRHSAEGSGRDRTAVRYQGYTSHVGAILQTKKYVDYYLEQGLNTGNSELSARLRDLKMRRGSSSSAGTESTLSTMSSGSQRSRTGGDRAHDKSCNRAAADDKVPPSENSKQDSQESAETIVEVDVPDQQQKADEAAQTSLNSLNNKETQTVGLTPDTTLDTTLDSPFTANNTLNEPQTPAENPTATEDVRKEGDEYSDDFEEEDIDEEYKVYSERRKKSADNEDARSIQTYMSVEHAEEVRDEQ